MLRAIAMLAVAASTGCYAMLEPSLRTSSAKRMPCPSEQVQVSNYQQGYTTVIPSTWSATGCGRTYSCQMSVASPDLAMMDGDLTCVEATPRHHREPLKDE